MKILFDQGVPAPLRHHLGGHTVDTAYEQVSIYVAVAVPSPTATPERNVRPRDA